MDNLVKTVNLLSSVLGTMDTISVSGLDNQNKFVGCANAVQTAVRALEQYISEHHVNAPEVKEEPHG